MRQMVTVMAGTVKRIGTSLLRLVPLGTIEQPSTIFDQLAAVVRPCPLPKPGRKPGRQEPEGNKIKQNQYEMAEREGFELRR